MQKWKSESVTSYGTHLMDVRHIEGDICPQARLIDESPSCPAGAEAFCCIIEPFSNWGREPYFPALTPHREVPYPIYMSPYHRGWGGGGSDVM